MPIIRAEGIDLYYEEAGSGTPILFIHEMGGNFGSWEPQMRHFSRRHRCIVYSARGYPPSSVPADPAVYSQEQAARDAAGLLDGLGIEKAHIVGLSMGSFTTLQFGLDFAHRALSLTIAGCGSGSEPSRYTESQARYRKMSREVLEGRFSDFVDRYSRGPYREPFRRKDPRGWQEFADRLAANSQLGMGLILQGVQARRPSLWALETNLKSLSLPAMVVCGDRDTPCVEPSVFLSRALPHARLFIFGDTGHTVNLEEPELFNRILQDFLADTAS